jgi:uncharacterized protein YeaO (DUF488 family)
LGALLISAKSIRLKSLKDPTEESDGLRILIARFRPRYLPKEKENWDEWWKELAPSKSLWRDYLKDKKIDWPEYSRRYKTEIKDNPQGVKALHKLSSKSINGIAKSNKHNGNQQEQQKLHSQDHPIIKSKVVTLLCHCKDEKYCHRSIVKSMLDELSEN